MNTNERAEAPAAETIRSYKVEHVYRPLAERKPWTTIFTVTTAEGARRRVKVAGKLTGRRAAETMHRFWTQYPNLWGE
jgi:hypothetical protein